jgi:hypothetical protein
MKNKPNSFEATNGEYENQNRVSNSAHELQNTSEKIKVNDENQVQHEKASKGTTLIVTIFIITAFLLVGAIVTIVVL